MSETDTGTDPHKDDTDGDDWTDGDEVLAGTDPNDKNEFPLFPVPVAWWPFDDGESETADVAGTNPGSVNGGASFVAGHTGAPGDQAINFDGVDSSVTTEFTMNGMVDFTVSGWAKFDDVQPERTGLFGQNDLNEMGPNTDIAWWMPTGGTINSGVDIAKEWTHIAMVGRDSGGAEDPPTGRFLYIDGELVGESDVPPDGRSTGFTFNIGGDGIWDGTGNFFTGQIDDVIVWDSALDEDQIGQLASQEWPPAGPPVEFEITDINYDIPGQKVTLTFNSTSGVSYAGDVSDDLQNWQNLKMLPPKDPRPNWSTAFLMVPRCSTTASKLRSRPDESICENCLSADGGRPPSAFFLQSVAIRRILGHWCGSMSCKIDPSLHRERKPDWIKVRLPRDPVFWSTKSLVSDLRLHTVCEEAECPNRWECWSQGTATFMIAGDRCTRACGFCAVKYGKTLSSWRLTSRSESPRRPSG